MIKSKKLYSLSLTKEELEMLLDLFQDEGVQKSYLGDLKKYAQCRERDCAEFKIYQLYLKIKKAHIIVDENQNP